MADEGNEPDGMVAVQLRPRRVTVGGQDSQPEAPYREAPLEIYRQLASPVTALQSGARQPQHLNADHPGDVVDYVARRHGIPRDRIAAATLDQLDGEARRCRGSTSRVDTAR